MTYHITICGGGNAAHTLAGLLSSKDELSVHIYAPLGDEAERWEKAVMENNGITIKTPQNTLLGKPGSICKDPGIALADSQLVILALPAFAHETILKQISPYIPSGAWVGALPARAGFDLCARNALKDRLSDIAIFGFQTLPWACRIQEYGKRVTILGAKDQVDLTAWPSEKAPVIADYLKDLLEINLFPISNFLSLTLADTGQLIHPGIMYGLFHNWDGDPFIEAPPFYQSVDADIAEILQQMSDEIHSICQALENKYTNLDLSAVRSLGEWLKRSYQTAISDHSSLQSSFVTNKTYTGLMAPMQKTDRGLTPDFNARYLSEDVPFDLLVSRGIAELADVSTPVIDRVLHWAQMRLGREYLVNGKLQGKDIEYTRTPQRYGFTNINKFVQEMDYV